MHTKPIYGGKSKTNRRNKSKRGGASKKRTMKGGAADLALYNSAGALPGTSTQVINTFGNIGQQTGSAGTNSGLIQPISNAVQPMKGGRGRKVKGGSAVAANAGLVGGNQLVTAPVAAAGSAVAGSAVAGSAVAHDSTNNIFPQSVPTKPISGGKRRKGKRSVKRGGGEKYDQPFTDLDVIVIYKLYCMYNKKTNDDTYVTDQNEWTYEDGENIYSIKKNSDDITYRIYRISKDRTTNYGDENRDAFKNVGYLLTQFETYINLKLKDNNKPTLDSYGVNQCPENNKIIGDLKQP